MPEGWDPERVAWWQAMEAAYGESPVHRVLGLGLRVLGPGTVAIDYRGESAAGNRSGSVAGGALAQMVDSAVVQACRSMLGPNDGAVTVDLAVSFVRPARTGRPLCATGRLVHLAGTLGVARAEVVDPAGVAVTIGHGTVRVRRSIVDAKQFSPDATNALGENE